VGRGPAAADGGVNPGGVDADDPVGVGEDERLERGLECGPEFADVVGLVGGDLGGVAAGLDLLGGVGDEEEPVDLLDDGVDRGDGPAGRVSLDQASCPAL